MEKIRNVNKSMNSDPEIYRIKIKGFLDYKWSEWFNGFAITHNAEDETILVGPVSDQEALHGMLAKIRDLGLPLLAVECLLQEKK